MHPFITWLSQKNQKNASFFSSCTHIPRHGLQIVSRHRLSARFSVRQFPVTRQTYRLSESTAQQPTNYPSFVTHSSRCLRFHISDSITSHGCGQTLEWIFHSGLILWLSLIRYTSHSWSFWTWPDEIIVILENTWILRRSTQISFINISSFPINESLWN